MTEIVLLGLKEGFIWFPLVLGLGLLFAHLREIDISIDGNAILSGIAAAAVWNATRSYTLSLGAGCATGLVIGSLMALLTSYLRVSPLMAGLVVSLFVHSVSLIFVGESLALTDTSLLGGMLDFPVLLPVMVLAISLLVSFFYQTPAGLAIRKLGNGSPANLRYPTDYLRWLAYATAGSLYGFGAALYAHSEGVAKSGGSFEFLVVALVSFLAFHRLVTLAAPVFARSGVFKTNLAQLRTSFQAIDIPLQCIAGSILFEVMVFMTIAYTANPVLWKLALSTLLLIALLQPSFKRLARNHSCDQGDPASLQLSDFGLHYPLGLDKRVVFAGARAEFHRGISLIEGMNGTGKSSLLNALAGSVPTAVGQACFGGRDLLQTSVNAREVFIVKQNPMACLASEMTVVENLIVSLPLRVAHRYKPWQHSIVRELERRLSAEFGLALIRPVDDPFWHSRVRHLSGGECQTVALYCSLLADKGILLLDEPTTGLDNHNFARLAATLARLREHKVMLVTSHDPRLRQLADARFTIDDCTLRGVRSDAV